MARQYSSISQETTLTADLAASTSTVTVNVQSAANLMGGITLTSGDTYTVVVDPDTANEEILYVTAVVGNALTVTRAQDSTTVKSHATGAKIRHMAIGEDFRLAETHRDSSTGVHGLDTSSAVVGTTDTQTLTNKTITGTFTGNLTGDVTGNVTGNLTGNASSATQLATARDITLTGDVTGTTTFSGTNNVSITAAIGSEVIVNADVSTSAAIAYSKLNLADSIVDSDVNTSAAIAYGKLNLGGQITSADIVDGTIVNTDIASTAAIALSKLAVDPLARANHTGTQTSGTISDFDTQVRSSTLNQMTAPSTSLSINSQKLVDVADPTANQDAVTLKYLNDQKGANNGIASLDSGGKIPTGQLPSIAVTETYVVSSAVAMTSLSAQVGDIAVRTDVNKSFILTTDPASTLANWQELLTPTDSVLSVDGNTGAIDLTGTYLAKAGGTMTGNLVLNADPSADLGAATKQYVDAVAGSATAAASSATAAEAAYDSFDDRYLGAKATPPSTDNDGNPLIVGAIYWDTVSNAMYAWSGTEWGSISSTAAIYRYRYTAAGGETSVSGVDDNGNTLSYLPGKEQVYLNGVLLVRTTDYTATSGTSITSLAALAASDVLEIITFTSFDLATAIQLSAFDAKGDLLVGAAADTQGKLSVGTNGYVLTADSTETLGVKWADPLPSQTGNNGYFLTTDGTSPSWASVPQPDLGITLTAPVGSTPDSNLTATVSLNSGFYSVTPVGNTFTEANVGGNTITTTSNRWIELTETTTSATIKSPTAWTLVTGVNPSIMNGLAYGNSTYVVGGNSARVSYSTDLINWTSVANINGNSTINGLAYGAGVFVAVQGGGRLATSTDGITWTSRTSEFGTTNINKVVFGNNLFVAVGNQSQVRTSTDGITWSTVTTGIASSTLDAVGYGNNLYLVGNNVNSLAVSTDGISWTTSTPFSTSQSLKDITYDGSLYILAGGSGEIATSTDGTTWTTRTSPLGATTIDSLIYGNGLYLLLQNDVNFTSTDGITWTTNSANDGASLRKAFYVNNNYIYLSSLSSSGNIEYTTDPTSSALKVGVIIQPAPTAVNAS